MSGEIATPVIMETVWHICLPVPSVVMDVFVPAVSGAAKADGNPKASMSATVRRIILFIRQRFVLPGTRVKPNLKQLGWDGQLAFAWRKQVLFVPLLNQIERSNNRAIQQL